MRIGLILAFFIGLLCQQHASSLIPLGWSLLLIPLFGLWFRAFKSPKNHFYSQIIGILCLFMIGVFWTAFRAELALSHRLDPALEGIPLTVTGTIISLPDYHPQHVTFLLAVDNIETDPLEIKPKTQPKKILFSWYKQKKGELPLLQAGQQWKVTATLKRPHRPQNPHTYDPEVRYLQTGIDAFGSVKMTETPTLQKEWHPSLTTLIARVREKISNRILSDPHLGESKGLMLALSIGEQRLLQGKFRTLFAATGTSHLMAISGLHLSAISLITASFIGWWWRKKSQRLLVLPAQYVIAITAAISAILYAAIAGFGIPVQRAALMVITACLLLCSKRSLSTLSILAQALFIVTLFDPWAPFFPGFWLSFGTVFLIILTSKTIDPSQPFRKVRQLVFIQIILSLALIPLSWWFFQQISLVSIVANLIAIPLVTFIILPLVLCTAIIDWAFLSRLTHFMLTQYIELLEWLASWPFSHFILPKPPFWTILAALGGILFWLKWSHTDRLTSISHARFLRWLGLISLLPLLFWKPSIPDLGEAKIIIFDIGQGNAALIQTRHHQLMVDTGPIYPHFPPAAQRIILPYLKAEGIRHFDGILITHRDVDHAGGLPILLEKVPTEWVMSSESLDLLSGQRQIYCRAPSRWVWDNVTFEILYPTPADIDRYETSNDRSCLLKVSTPSNSILFTGDLGANVLRQLSASPIKEKLKSTFLIAPHHGSETTSPIEFIEQNNADHVIFSAGYQNRYRHPNAATLERYGPHSRRLWRTDQEGAIVIDMKKDTYEIGAWREMNRRYWY